MCIRDRPRSGDRCGVVVCIRTANTTDSAETTLYWDKNKMFLRTFSLNKYLNFPRFQVSSQVYIQPLVQFSPLFKVSAADFILAVVEAIAYLQVETQLGIWYSGSSGRASFLLWIVV